ncbi:hypothetical protein PR729_26905 [Providencia rettgeri]|nr:hypothetical protein PR729_26905 [Providencia rettgeri]
MILLGFYKEKIARLQDIKHMYNYPITAIFIISTLLIFVVIFLVVDKKICDLFKFLIYLMTGIAL